MAKKKSVEIACASEQQASRQLIGELQFLSEEVEKLTVQVTNLADHAKLLTASIDDVRCEIEWAIKNLHRPKWAPTQAVSSVPHDAQAETCVAQKIPVKSIASSQQPPLASVEEKQQGKLWD